MKLKFLLTISAVFTAVSLSAETNILLDQAFDGGYRPPADVTVETGELLRLAAYVEGTDFQWFKDGEPIEGAHDPILVFDRISRADVGSYQFGPRQIGIPERGSQILHLNVGPVERFVNLSTRAMAGSGEETLIGGFVVSGPQDKRILIRAVGPSLANVNVAGFLADPVIHIYDQTGALYTREFNFNPDAGETEAAAIADATLRTGAAPLSAGGGDAVEFRPFSAGVYTVHVTSASDATGVVVLEIFEVPETMAQEDQNQT